MAIEIACPHCDWILSIDPATVHQQVHCWNCDREFVIFAAEAATTSVATVNDSPPIPNDQPRPRRIDAWKVIGAVSFAALVGSIALTWVSVQRATVAERSFMQMQLEKEQAEQDAAKARLEAERERVAAEVARSEADQLAAAERARPAAACDIPDDVRESATATLRKIGAAAEPLFRKALSHNKDLLPRLKSGEIVKKVGIGVRVPSDKSLPVSFPSQSIREAEIIGCETRIAAAEKALLAWESNDLDFFAPNLTTPAKRGTVGRIVDRQVRVLAIPDEHSAHVSLLAEAPTRPGGPRNAQAVICGVTAGRFTPGLVSEFNEIVVVAGTVELGGETYPKLAVFSASKR